MELHFSFFITLFALLFSLWRLAIALIGRSSVHGLHKKLPPGPWKLPLIGNLHQMVSSLLPHHHLQNLAKKHGSLMHLQLGEISTIVVSSSKFAEEVMKVHDLSFASRPKIESAKVMTYNYSDIALAPYGDTWRQMRKFCTLELLSSKSVKSFQSIREEEVWRMVEAIHHQVQLSSSSSINLTKLIYPLINQITFRATFGERCKEQDELLSLLLKITSISIGFELPDVFPSFKYIHFLSRTTAKIEKMMSAVEKILDSFIKENSNKLHESGKDCKENLLGHLLKLQESGSLEYPFTSNHIKGILTDIMTAGTDTSSGTIEWAMSEMILNPRVMQKAQNEVRQAFNGKQRVDEANLQRLSYLKQVIKETLRFHPPSPLLIPRECIKECQIEGYNIPVKTMVIVNAWAIGRDPHAWDNADKFIPERFDVPMDFNGTNFNYIPFGAGRRMCPGLSFGLAMVELTLAELLFHFNWKLPNGMQPKDLNMTETFGSTATRKNELHLNVESRTPLGMHSCSYK